MQDNITTNETLTTKAEDKHHLHILVDRLPLDDPEQMHDALFQIVTHCDAMARRWCPEYHIVPETPDRRLGDVKSMIADFQSDIDKMFADFYAQIRP